MRERYEAVMTSTEEPRQRAPAKAKKAHRGERWIYGGATAITIGIVASLADLGDVGAQLTLGGFLAAVFGLHKLGRSGPIQA